MSEDYSVKNTAAETAAMPETNNVSSAGQRFVKYLIISCMIAILILLVNTFSAKGVSLGFWHGTLALIGWTIAPGIGAIVGDTLRRICMPDSIFTSGGMGSILKAKIFWSIGPQCIGWYIGFTSITSTLDNFFR